VPVQEAARVAAGGVEVAVRVQPDQPGPGAAEGRQHADGGVAVARQQQRQLAAGVRVRGGPGDRPLQLERRLELRVPARRRVQHLLADGVAPARSRPAAPARARAAGPAPIRAAATPES
jgi:hypothetical protein